MSFVDGRQRTIRWRRPDDAGPIPDVKVEIGQRWGSCHTVAREEGTIVELRDGWASFDNGGGMRLTPAGHPLWPVLWRLVAP